MNNPDSTTLQPSPTQLRIKRTPKAPRQRMPLLEDHLRRTTCKEVALGFTLEQARAEALRCLDCRDPKCVEACPLHIDVKSFIARIVEGDYLGAAAKIFEQSPFPGICGRVCQKELYCEKDCLLGSPKTKLEPVAIGALERFAADYYRHAGESRLPPVPPWNGMRVALVGSGPASLITAFDLVRKGYKVTILEALHELGGVLAYGIPPFRLPRDIIREELDHLRAMGVEFRTDFIVGKTCTLPELFQAGFDAVFLGTGAGLPHLMGIPGENLIGVYTANEFLTRINL
ncbi:MAG: FAD-dependent oxidoreductase, partial [Bryobacterales bacterium]|nr:FAD-dependent oxidoreductase [Bryobacteraceae bacterium]MDW8131844.1 FAD-dependent oxidoreductase [Bryobacterales bacterium]